MAVIAPDTLFPLPPKAPVQQEFSEIMAALGVSEVHGLPAGASALAAKELIFVARLLQHGRMSQAASEAGYKGENVAVTASKLLRRPEVQIFYGRCVAQLAANANQVIARVYERSVAAHSEAMRCFQQMQELDAEQMEVESETESVSSGKESDHTSTSTRRQRLRERLAKDFARFDGIAAKNDTLLASMLGKLNVNVTGEVKVVQVTQQAMNILSEIRRQNLTPAQAAASNN